MRTTVTLDPDVQALLDRAMRERGITFKEAVNSAVRAGLARGHPKRRKFAQATYSLGRERNFRWDKALEAASAIEDEELARKCSLRK